MQEPTRPGFVGTPKRMEVPERTSSIRPAGVLATACTQWGPQHGKSQRRSRYGSTGNSRETAQALWDGGGARSTDEADGRRLSLVPREPHQTAMGKHPVAGLKPLAVELWLKGLDLVPKTKGHLQNLLRVLFNCAMRWEFVEVGQNPMRLVRVRGGSKRGKEPKVLTIAQFQRLVEQLSEPYRTMVILDLATGLRRSELFAFKWCDVNWEDITLLVRRGIVDTVVSDVKTEYSRAGMPLDPALAEVLLNWRRTTEFNKPDDWVFASPFKGGMMPGSPGECSNDISAPQLNAAA
jgi:hypothetical protein